MSVVLFVCLVASFPLQSSMVGGLFVAIAISSLFMSGGFCKLQVLFGLIVVGPKLAQGFGCFEVVCFVIGIPRPIGR